MRSYDRPQFERQREQDRSYRDREFPSSRRGYWRSDDDDDRGPWISRDRDEFDDEFRGRRRFEQFEDWERPRELSPGHRHSSGSFSGAAYGYGYSGGGAAYGSPFGRGRQEPEGRYAGRGPKGYQRSDERLKEEVCERLTADPFIDASDVEVSVEHGEVMLEGTVRDRNMKRAADDCVDAIFGVQQVHNRLRVDSREFGHDEGLFSSRN